MLDDFHDAYAFMEYMEYGDEAQLKIFNAFCTNGQEPNHAGEIYIFLNYKQVGRFKKKSEALQLVRKLIAEAPKSARKDFEEFDTISKFLKD